MCNPRVRFFEEFPRFGVNIAPYWNDEISYRVYRVRNFAEMIHQRDYNLVLCRHDVTFECLHL